MDDENFLASLEEEDINAPVEDPKPEEETPKEEVKQEPEQSAPAEAAPVEPVEPVETPAVVDPPTPEAPQAPLAALLDERDKRKAAEERAAFLEAQIRQQQQQAQMPDIVSDPEGFAAVQAQQFQQAMLNQTLNTSERFARKEYGAETVESAKTWATQRFASDPLYQQQVLSDPDPYERVVQDWKRDQIFSKVKDPLEFDEFFAWKAAQGQLRQAAPAAPATPSSPIPPRSLASAPSAGNMLTEPAQSDEEMFDEVIGKG